MPISSGAQSTSSVTAQSRNRCGEMAFRRPAGYRVSICCRITALRIATPRSSQRRTPTPIWPLTRCNQLHSIEPQPLTNVRGQLEENGGTTKAVPAARSRLGPGVLLASPELIARTITAVRRENGAAEDTDLKEGDVIEALGALESVWDELYPAEQVRILRLPIERIDVARDAISVTLHAAGIRNLVAELADQGAPALAASEPLLEAAE